MVSSFSRRPGLLFPICMLFGAAVALPACTGANANEDRMLDEMRRQIDERTSDGSSDKLGVGLHGSSGMPGTSESASPSAAPAAEPSPAVPTPALPVVRVVPAEADEAKEYGVTSAGPASSAEPVLHITNANLPAMLKSASGFARVSSSPNPQRKPKAKKPAEPASQAATQ